MGDQHTPPSLVAASIDVIADHQAPTGAYLAAPAYDAYSYCWLRDGAFIASAMDAHGRHASAASFHEWAARTIDRHAHKVRRLEAEVETALERAAADPLNPLDEAYTLHTRFTVGGEEGREEWGNFQLDGYGFWLTSIVRHLSATANDPAPYETAIRLVCRYLILTWQLPCFDSWEEYPTRRHMTTWAAIARGLRDAGKLLGDEASLAAAAHITAQLVDLTRPHAVLRKFVPDAGGRPAVVKATASSAFAIAGHERIGNPLAIDAIDGSALLVLGDFGPFPPQHGIVSATLQAIEESLVVEGGVHRYLEDEYYGGGLWIMLAGALAYAQAPHNATRAREVLDWIERQADGALQLAEQSTAHLRKPEGLAPWTKRWGPPASPLLWSHAMYLLGYAGIDAVATAPGSPTERI